MRKLPPANTLPILSRMQLLMGFISWEQHQDSSMRTQPHQVVITIRNQRSVAQATAAALGLVVEAKIREEDRNRDGKGDEVGLEEGDRAGDVASNVVFE